jgi:hypothetical protein
VHEQVVICPHCAGPTGVPADPIAQAEIEVMRPVDEHQPSPLTLILQPLPAPLAAKPSSRLPRAIARRRSRDR